MTAWAFRVWALALVAYFGARLLVGDASAGAGVLGTSAALWVGGPSKLLAFALATIFALRTVAAFEPDNPARAGWRMLGLGFLGFACGQAVLVVHQLAIPGDTPFPNPGDVAFLLGYGALAVALLRLTRTFAESGLAVGTEARHVELASLAIGLLGMAAMWRLLGSGGVDSPLLERLLGAAYPALDCLLLVPVAFLARITIAMRHGRIARPWIRLLVGVAVFTIGDITFAVASTFEIVALDPLFDLCFALGYLFAAWGCHAQLVLVRET